jgi:peptide/nickel transport system substrate-binding protein
MNRSGNRGPRHNLGAVLATVAALVALASGVGASSSPTAAPSASGHQKVTFVYGSTREPSSLNPMIGYLAVEFYFWAWTYHLPISFAVNDLGAAPDLVTHVDTSPDGRTFTYTIRDDVTWSDGVPLTAKDVAFTLNLYKSKHAYLPQAYLKLVDSVTAPDDTTVVLHTTQPTSLFSGAVPYLYTYILPEHVWSKLDQPKNFDNVPSVGSGPFYIAEYQPGQFVRLERNKYWSGPDPHIDEIIYRIFKNEDAEAEALKSGEIDFGYFDSANVLNSLKGQPNIATEVGTVPEFDELAMNTGSAVQPAQGAFKPHGDGHPALADPVVRRAIRMAVDSKELVDKVLLGYGEPGTSIVPPVSIAGARWVPTGSDLIPFDLKAAAKLLEDHGYRDTNGDGIREMPGGGRPLDFRYYVRTVNENTVKAAPFIQDWLRQIGIKTEVTALTDGRLTDEINAGTYDLFQWDWLPDPDPDSLLAYFTCDQRPPDGHTYGNDDSYHCDPVYDRLYQEQRTTLDTAKRLQIIQEMQKRFYEDCPYAVLWYGPSLQAYRTDVFTGYRPQPAPHGDLLDGYSRDAVLDIRPVSAAAGGSASTATKARGIAAGVWIAIAAGVVVILGAIVLVRRRSGAAAERE